MRRRWIMGYLSVVAAFLASCDSGAGKKHPPAIASATSSIGPTLSPSVAAQQDALAAYRGMWDAFVAAGKVSDPDAVDVRKYASNQALQLIVNDLYTNRQLKRVIRGDLKIDPHVTGVKPASDPSEATVTDCVNDEKWLVYKASGGLVNDVPGGRHHTTATVKRTPDGWKVDSFLLEEAGTC